MANATTRRQHPNAPLTPEGRRRMVACVVDQGWSVTVTAERFQVDAKTVRKWRERFLCEVMLGLRIGRLGRIGLRTGPRDGCGHRWFIYGIDAGGVPITSGSEWAWRPRLCRTS